MPSAALLGGRDLMGHAVGSRLRVDAHPNSTGFLPKGRRSTLWCFKISRRQSFELRSGDRGLNTQAGQRCRPWASAVSNYRIRRPSLWVSDRRSGLRLCQKEDYCRGWPVILGLCGGPCRWILMWGFWTDPQCTSSFWRTRGRLCWASRILNLEALRSGSVRTVV